MPNPVCRSPLTAPEDARVTPVGRFLRRYKLDELPQLWNVLKGEMRLVGVRPQVDRYVELFRAEYQELLQDPPGITGLPLSDSATKSNCFMKARSRRSTSKKSCLAN